MATRHPGGTDGLSDDVLRRLDDLRLGLLTIHKALLNHERIRYEREHGRVPSSGEFLQLAIHDPWFAWLRPLSALVVRIDEALAAVEPVSAASDAEQLIAEARALLRADESGGDGFAGHYYRALQDAPEVVMAHSTWKRLTGAAKPARAPTVEASPTGTGAIDSRVRIGHVHLKVADLSRSLEFYIGVLGFELTQRYGAGAAFISAGGYHHHIGLNTWESLGGSPPPPTATGLYHVAILYPTRAELADALHRLIAAGIALDGASDHGVSEALYLRDPDGNGVELYWDRPKDEWPRTPDGKLAMFTRPLDLQELLRS